jgi:hypothetical protein
MHQMQSKMGRGPEAPAKGVQGYGCGIFAHLCSVGHRAAFPVEHRGSKRSENVFNSVYHRLFGMSSKLPAVQGDCISFAEAPLHGIRQPEDYRVAVGQTSPCTATMFDNSMLRPSPNNDAMALEPPFLCLT